MNYKVTFTLDGTRNSAVLEQRPLGILRERLNGKSMRILVFGFFRKVTGSHGPDGGIEIRILLAGRG